MKMIKGDKVAIVCCSNGQSETKKKEIEKLKRVLEEIGLIPVLSKYIYQKSFQEKEQNQTEQRLVEQRIEEKEQNIIEQSREKQNIIPFIIPTPAESGLPEERAAELMTFYKEDSIKAIFDISGGDLANTVLPYLDYEQIATANKQFWGYSDLTAIINAIYTKTGKTSVLYQVRNLLYENAKQQVKDFKETIFADASKESDRFKNNKSIDAAESGNQMGGLYDFLYKFCQGNALQGTVVGGNIRCFLKLAGTEYFPDLTDKILLLEARSGSHAQLLTYLSQLEQLGAFQKIKGIVLGTFTQMEREQQKSDIYQLLRRYITPEMPVVKTQYIGHGMDSKAIEIGREYKF